MNIMDETPAKIKLHIDGMTWEQVREMIEERYGALMWDHKSTAYPTDSVVVRMAFAEPSGNVAQRAIGKAAPQQEAQEPVAGHCRFPGGAWAECSPEHVRMVRANSEEWKGYEVRYLYAEPQPSPAAQGDALDAARWHWLSEHIQVAWNEGKFTSLVRIVSEQHRQSLNASVDRMMAGDWSDAARAAQEGK